MAQKSNLNHSLKFANLAQKNLVSKAGRKDKGVKQAGFWVLWATSMPAVLVELDFICNPTSAEFLGSEKGQEKMAQALYDAVEKYIINTTNNSAKAVAESDSKNSANENKHQQENINKGAEEHVMPTLMEVEPEIKEINVSNQGSSRAAVSTSRKRRSISAKRNSEQQDYEAQVLDIRSETDRMLITSKVESPQIEEEIITQRYQPVTKKKSKGGKNVAKNNVPSKKADIKAGDKRIVNNQVVYLNKGNKGNATIVVATNNPEKEVAKAQESKSSQTISRVAAMPDNTLSSSTQSNAQPPMNAKRSASRTIYKIQLLESEEFLKQNDEKFCGLKPIKTFKENNIYKYTYGESENKDEIESMLNEVKLLIPQAHIISSHR